MKMVPTTWVPEGHWVDLHVLVCAGYVKLEHIDGKGECVVISAGRSTGAGQPTPRCQSASAKFKSSKHQ